jgi:hypothetical protein
MVRFYAIALSSAVCAACQGALLDVGSNNGGGGVAASATSGSGVGGPTAPIPGAALCTFVPDGGGPGDAADASDASSGDAAAGDADTAPLVGTWRGSVSYPSFARALALTFPSLGGAEVTFGNAPPIPAPTSGNMPWPPSPDGSAVEVDLGSAYAGFAYSATNGSFDGTTLSFGIVTRQLLKQWCELQISYAWTGWGADCSCLPIWAGGVTAGNGCEVTNPDSGAQEPVSCALLQWCWLGASNPSNTHPAACDCTAGSCTVDMTTANMSFALQLTPGHLDGVMYAPTSAPVHLTRAP